MARRQGRDWQCSTVILDTRSDDEYCGTTVRAKRGGAIPGAVHIEWTQNLTPEGEFKPAAELRAMYEHAGVTPDREVITYCQGGYRAAHAYLALRLLGYPRVRSYVGSWKEWGDREDLPIEVPKITVVTSVLMNNIIDFINTNRDRYVDELKQYLAIPSISALPQHSADVRRCAEWTADEMRRIGLQNVRLIETPGNPVVYGDWLGAAGAPTILFYGHYDVQPVDPLELVGIAAVRSDDPRRRDLRARRRGRQGAGLHALQGHRSAPEAERDVCP